MIFTHSKFYYGFTVTAENQNLDFNEGGSELTAVLNIGTYTLTQFALEIARAFNTAGDRTYTTSVNRSIRAIMISADGTFSLLVSSGSHIGTTGYTLSGFTGADLTSGTTFTGVSAGIEYSTQYKVQSYTAPEDFKDVTYGSVNLAASGDVEVVTFGDLRYMEADLQYVNDYDHGDFNLIRSHTDGIEQLRALMDYLTTLAPVEFMPDENDANTFISVRLEKTTDDPKGLKYKLKEQYTRNLPGYWNTGVLTFRVLT